jgi:hypothetical protein
LLYVASYNLADIFGEFRLAGLVLGIEYLVAPQERRTCRRKSKDNLGVDRKKRSHRKKERKKD